MKNTFLILPVMITLSFGLATLSGCTDHSQPNVEIIQDFMDSPAIKAQEYDADSPNHAGMRVPATGSVPVGFEPYRFATDLPGAIQNKNPLANDMSDGVLKVGQKYYNTNCMICHGANGEGSEKASVAELMALKPPTLLSDKVRGYSDGQLYHVITMGQGVMGPYAHHIPQASRWQVVNYVRHLQQAK